MKLTIEPTKHFFMAGDVMVRMWTGRDEAGGEVVVLVSAVAFAGQAAAVASGLVEIPPPDEATAQAWAQRVLARATGAS
jgi:hypothetical protein